jgi:hypothetical protein
VSEDLAVRLAAEPATPPMDLEQLRAVKAELRNLVPGIHEAPSSPPPALPPFFPLSLHLALEPSPTLL